MTKESETYEKKSLRFISGTGADWKSLARECVAFASARGGKIDIGIEDDSDLPPVGQKIPEDLPSMVEKKIRENTVNVICSAKIKELRNINGEFLRITIGRSTSVPSTSDGRYYTRVSDQCVPITGDGVRQLFTDRPTYDWETEVMLDISQDAADPELVRDFVKSIKASDRVKNSVKNSKTDTELLEHYKLARDGKLTNLGVLCLATAADRVRLGSAPIIQAVKYDQQEKKVAKWRWDDHSLSPIRLIDDIWETIPDFKEFYEIPDGMKRVNIPTYIEPVVRELLVNAFVHRAYTQGGDIFLSIHPDWMTIASAGSFPPGVRPSNILNASTRRNQNLARIFHDLHLMEGEGTGFDMIYEQMLALGKEIPKVEDRHGRVEVTIKRDIGSPEAIKTIAAATEAHNLGPRERIFLGILLCYGDTSVSDMAEMLELNDPINQITDWMGRLPELGIVKMTGTRVKFLQYELRPEKIAGRRDSIKNRAIEYISNNPGSASSEIRNRVAPDSKPRSFQRILSELQEEGAILAEGERRGRRYWLKESDKTPK